MTRNYYEVLGVAPDAEPDDIDYAFRTRTLALQGRHDGVSAEELKAVRWAYRNLKDPQSRAQYDAKLAEEATEGDGAESRRGLPGRLPMLLLVVGAGVVLAGLYFLSR